MEQLTGDLNLLAGFFLESVGGLLSGAFLLPALPRWRSALWS